MDCLCIFFFLFDYFYFLGCLSDESTVSLNCSQKKNVTIATNAFIYVLITKLFQLTLFFDPFVSIYFFFSFEFPPINIRNSVDFNFTICLKFCLFFSFPERRCYCCCGKCCSVVKNSFQNRHSISRLTLVSSLTSREHTIISEMKNRRRKIMISKIYTRDTCTWLQIPDQRIFITIYFVFFFSQYS